jgi:signal transduction histidine kinase
METEHGLDDPLTHLRWLAASDPKQARAVVYDLVRGNTDKLDAVLQSASRPGDGRLRQIIATVFRTDPTATILGPWLQQWLKVEPDEFTKSAIATALGARAVVTEARTLPRSSGTTAVEAYRYVADRLCHRVRNAMTLPTAQMLRLEQVAHSAEDAELRQELLEIHAGMQTGLIRIARNVEFDTNDGYLSWQSIPIIPWLEKNAHEFAARHGQARFAVNLDQSVRRVTIRATPFLLETTFGNIWSNAVQAADTPPCIEIQCAVAAYRNQITMLILDSGPGFPESQLDTAFYEVFSTKAPSRGRGLLEIGDAITRLQGAVRLEKDHRGRYRLALSLPLETP